jgi:hypothetical protein
MIKAAVTTGQSPACCGDDGHEPCKTGITALWATWPSNDSAAEMLADAAMPDKVGHHLKIARRKSRSSPLPFGVQLILGHAVLDAGIYRERIVFACRDQQFDPFPGFRAGCFEIVAAQHPELGSVAKFSVVEYGGDIIV